MNLITGPVAAKASMILTRIAVPGWILLGAGFKLVERTPSNLPSMFVAFARSNEVDPGFLLRGLISLEFLAIAVMVCLARWSRLMAIFMLGSFCAILLGEMYRSAASCGCFGSVKIPPWVMLSLDGSLLLAVLLFKPAKTTVTGGAAWFAAVAITVAGTAMSFGLPEKTVAVVPEDDPPAPEVTPIQSTDPDVTDPAGGATPPVAPSPVPEIDCTTPPAHATELPAWWYAQDIETWTGLCWNQLELFSMIRQYPADIATGKKYIAFFRTDCDHCEDMFLDYFEGQLDAPVLAYEIFSDQPEWMVARQSVATVYDLPKIDWVVETPLIIVLQDGEVICAHEGEGFEACFEDE